MKHSLFALKKLLDIDYTPYFHGTEIQNLNKILAHGIKRSLDKYVCLSRSIDLYAPHAGIKRHFSKNDVIFIIKPSRKPYPANYFKEYGTVGKNYFEYESRLDHDIPVKDIKACIVDFRYRHLDIDIPHVIFFKGKYFLPEEMDTKIQVFAKKWLANNIPTTPEFRVPYVGKEFDKYATKFLTQHYGYPITLSGRDIGSGRVYSSNIKVSGQKNYEQALKLISEGITKYISPEITIYPEDSGLSLKIRGKLDIGEYEDGFTYLIV